MPSCFAASSMMALLSALLELSFEDATAAPVPAAATTATAPTITLFLRLIFMDEANQSGLRDR
jgi:hypothetical protein